MRSVVDINVVMRRIPVCVCLCVCLCPKSKCEDLFHLVTGNKLYRLYCLTLRRLTSYIYGAPILDVSRSHTTTQHSR